MTENRGMASVQSPRVLYIDIIPSVELTEQGVRVDLGVGLSEKLAWWTMFPNNPTTRIIEKGTDYFIASGSGACDFIIQGPRLGFENTYWIDKEV